MTAEQAQLQLARQLFGDRLRDEAAEAGVDPVRVLAGAVRGSVDELAGGPHLCPRTVGERRALPVHRDRPDVLDRQVLARQLAPAHVFESSATSAVLSGLGRRARTVLVPSLTLRP